MFMMCRLPRKHRIIGRISGQTHGGMHAGQRGGNVVTTFASPIKLYGGRGCGWAAVEVLLAFAEKPYKSIVATPWEPTPALDDLRRINPLARVQTYVLADGSVMSESAAIMIMQGEAVHGMVPTEANERAAFFRWMIFIPANIYALFLYVIFQRVGSMTKLH